MGQAASRQRQSESEVTLRTMANTQARARITGSVSQQDLHGIRAAYWSRRSGSVSPNGRSGPPLLTGSVAVTPEEAQVLWAYHVKRNRNNARVKAASRR